MLKGLYIYFIIFVSFLFLLSCENKKETIFRMPILNLPINYYSIYSSSDSYTNLVLRNIHDTLIEYENGIFVNGLTENWYSPSDGIITIILKDNIRFSDGSLLTIEDVKNTYEVVQQRLLNMNRHTTFIDSMITRTDNSIDIYSSIRLDDLRLLLNGVGILKTEYLQKDEEYFKNHEFATSGVYFISSKAAEKVILKKNKYHRNFEKNKNAPDIVELILQPDYEIQYKMFTEGQIDIVQYLPIELYEKVFLNSENHVIEEESNIIVYMILNGSRPTIRSQDNPLKDKRVRQAIASTIDTKSFIENHLYSKAYQLILPTLKHLSGYPMDREGYEYDIQYSLSLLKEAGYEDGFEMTIQTVDGKYSKPLAEFTKESLKNINIEVHIEYVELSDITNLDLNQAASIHSIISRSTFSLEERLKVLYYYDEKNISVYNRFNNYVPRINQLIDILLNTNEYNEQLLPLRKELTDIIIDEAFVIPFINPIDLHLLNKKFSIEDFTNIKFKDIKVN